MIDKEKQIEEMVEHIKIVIKNTEPDFNGYRIPKTIELAEELLKYYQPKIDKDSVVQPTIQSYSTHDNDLIVLSREEYAELKHTKILLKELEKDKKFYQNAVLNNLKEIEKLENQLKQERKEATEKIMQDLKPLLEGFVHKDTGENLYAYKCKQFGVEVKE